MDLQEEVEKKLKEAKGDESLSKTLEYVQRALLVAAIAGGLQMHTRLSVVEQTRFTAADGAALRELVLAQPTVPDHVARDLEDIKKTVTRIQEIVLSAHPQVSIKAPQ